MRVPLLVATSRLPGERVWLGPCGAFDQLLVAGCWLVALCFSGWFCLFVCGMFGGKPDMLTAMFTGKKR